MQDKETSHIANETDRRLTRRSIILASADELPNTEVRAQSMYNMDDFGQIAEVAG